MRARAFLVSGPSLDWEQPTRRFGRLGVIWRHLLLRLLRPYLDQVLMSSAENPRAHQTFAEVLHLVKSPVALFHPAILLPVLARALRRAAAIG